ncbi:MAG: potassium-transporting ATPase subunit KdpA [Alphaproteobacteria bacterium]|nr:potassium-transporting ATPase subunit KdpA [Alphaproteobacteria bacterium]
MSGNGWLQLLVYFAVLFACVKPLGAHMARVYSGEKTFLSPVFGWLERGFYRLSGINPDQDMDWPRYGTSVIAFSVISFLGLYALLCCQGHLGLNPAALPDIPFDLAFNTAVSYITNTNWQAYAGETAMSLLSEMAGLTVQNFLSPAVGLAVMAAVIRGFARTKTSGIGNFWADMVRGVLYILLPLALLMALALASQGVVQTLRASAEAAWLDPSAETETAQHIATGPAASQVAIKQLGSNGGGFFNVNSAHPFENPTPLSNFLMLLAILLIPAAQCYMFGHMARDTRQGWVLLAAMTLIFVPMLMFSVAQEQAGNPRLKPLGVDQAVTAAQPGGNMEGKETRFGIVNSVLWANATTASSNGSVNAMMDSFTPLGGLVPLVLMQFGEVIYGGVGSGLYGMLVFVIVTVFLAGLMVGRTPEYLGKKIGVFEMKMAALAVLAPHLAALTGTALAVTLAAGKAGAFNPGAQGFSEILYAFTSAANNNGSVMAGLAANTPFYNAALGIAMLIGRYCVILPVLAMAGALAEKNTVPSSAGTLSTTTPLFVVILACVIVMVGVLTFIPTLALGPVAEYFHLTTAGQAS